MAIYSMQVKTQSNTNTTMIVLTVFLRYIFLLNRFTLKTLKVTCSCSHIFVSNKGGRVYHTTAVVCTTYRLVLTASNDTGNHRKEEENLPPFSRCAVYSQRDYVWD